MKGYAWRSLTRGEHEVRRETRDEIVGAWLAEHGHTRRSFAARAGMSVEDMLEHTEDFIENGGTDEAALLERLDLAREAGVSWRRARVRQHARPRG